MSRQQGIQDSIMRWLSTGPADDTLALAAAMNLDREKITNGVRRLVDLGYVTMTFKRSPTGGRPVYSHIELTDDGYRNMPDPIQHAETGSKFVHQMPSSRPGDGTDYRNQPSVAPVQGATVRTVVAPKAQPAPVVTRVPEQTPGTIQRDPWPILAELRNRDTLIAPLRKAIAVLAPGDPLRVQLERRVQEKMASLSHIEFEYLRYANAHPSNDVPKA